MNAIQLLQKLISIPSYLGRKTNEQKVGNFVFEYLKKISCLKAQKQKVEKGRFNIVVETEGDPRLLLAAHMDTVKPQSGWSKNLLKGTIEDNKLFGLGVLDTKSGLAAILDSLNDFERISGLTLLFYCDEEYDFKGMKNFIENRQKQVGTLAVIAEPSNLKIWNAHRGLIEIDLAIQGKSGHAADPQSGKNAINGLTSALNVLQKWLKKFKDPVLGKPSMNIAYIRGGLKLNQGKDGLVSLGKQGNIMADFAETIVDIRPTKTELRAKKIKKWLEKELNKNGYQLVRFSARHDFASLKTPKQQLKNLEKIIGKIVGQAGYLDPSKKGYGDGQLLQEKFNIPVVYLGPKGDGAHGVDEWVDIESLKKLREIYSSLIKKYCCQ